mgnify:CR=1 FL=1
MRRRLPWLLFAVGLGAAAWAEEVARPAVLLRCVGDLKPLLGRYGDGRVRSPDIDRLAAEGVTFERAYCKATNFKEAARIPLIVRLPGGKRASARTEALVESVDLFPTLTELAGLKSPAVPHLPEGRRFAAVLRDPAPAGRDAVVHSFARTPPRHGQRIAHAAHAARTARYRLVEWRDPGSASETAHRPQVKSREARP